MDKRKAHYIWRRMKKIHPLYFLAATLIFGTVSLAALRHNNEQMIELRAAVYQADEENGDVETALYELRSFVFAHMNTSLASGPNAVRPPIQLKYTYERLQADQQQKLGENNGAIYGAAQRSCEASGANEASEVLACIEEYMAARGVQLTPIPDGLYKFDFVSPRWSPDLAGWTLVFTIISFAIFIGLALYRWGIKKYLS